MEIIAEIGQNHNGDMNLAFELIAEAKRNGADAAKFQLYDAAVLFPRENNPWYEYNLSTELSRDDTARLAECCARMGIEFLASVFDAERVAWLEELGVRRYKIASRSIRDQELIGRLCRTGKPLLVSLGMWDKPEFPSIPSGVPVSFLYCVSQYPTPLERLHLGQVDFTRYAGLSDHTVGISAAQAALARGAGIIEKHFTLDRNMHGPDHVCSMTPGELAGLSGFRDDLRRLL
ncbi:N-acetylneuraminate synthase family protein [Desulfomicrobium orale]|uniref:PseI/NeuA/B-like domain-containing protein n=1 Tax=Desulfomicrobium orale DSM 12838 TaxID=888061 RepID=A0A109WAL3_9BACT|nr:N-acetylneuraminate synthase family protein [Desulfomicrobium orale]AMD91758.1 hypothetical protein AXF15_00580 [Desulfomicrobium orale DSM 12838]